MKDVDCKMQCHFCKEVFIVPTLTSNLPVHEYKKQTCQGSGQSGLFLSIHQKKK